jgi:hypothetical protein
METTMTTASISNDRPQRKQLSDEIDRLDQILDGLSEGINGAVADAAREGVREAVKGAIIELLTDATLRARLHEATAPERPAAPAETASKPGWWARLKMRATRTIAGVGQAAANVLAGASRGVQAISEAATSKVRDVQVLGSLKKLVVIGVVVGAVVGVASMVAPHVVAATVSGVTGAVAAAAIQFGVWAQRAVRAFATA